MEFLLLHHSYVSFVLIQLLLDLTEVELVLDPFMGSGTTGRVCDKLGRSFVGYDLKGY